MATAGGAFPAREGLVRALRGSSPRARRHFTRFDQVDRLARAALASPDRGFMARLMMLCSLPRTNPGRRLQYKRVNGPYTLIMTAVGKTGLPFGNLPRLLLAWVSTEAVRTQSRELFLGASLSEFMRKLDLVPVGGGTSGGRTGLRNQIKRLFNAHIQLTYENERVSASVNSPLASRTEFWWNPNRPHERALWESRIELGDKFFQEIVSHPVPLDMNILKALRRGELAPAPRTSPLTGGGVAKCVGRVLVVGHGRFDRQHRGRRARRVREEPGARWQERRAARRRRGRVLARRGHLPH